MEYPRQITVIQATIVIFSSVIGVGVLALPHIVVTMGDTGSPFVTFLGMCIAFIGLAFLTLLGMRFPNDSIVHYSEKLIGKWLASIGSITIISFYAILTALTSREFGEVVITAVLRETPLEVTVIVMLLIASLASRNGITVFTYIHHFYFPFILFPALLIVVLSLKNANILYLQPIFGNTQENMLQGTLTVAALFQGYFIFTLVIPHMRRPERAMIASIFGTLLSGGLYILIVIASLSVFGPEELKVLLWPTLELAKMTSLPGQILERLDAAFLAIWVTAVFTTLLSTYTLTIHLLSKLFRLRDHKMLSFFLLPLVFVLAMLPKNILHMYEVIEIVGRLGLLITVVYPLLLFVIALVRKKRGDVNVKKNKEQTS